MIDQSKVKTAYEEYLDMIKKDDRIIGAFLSGGRGKGVSAPESDYDVMLITNATDFQPVIKDYPKTEYIDSLVHAISDFRDWAKVGTKTQYDKYSFTHVKVLFDKTGDIQKMVNEKGILTKDEAYKIGKDSLNSYLNKLHRSLKNLRDKNILAGHLDAVETIPSILTFIFAIEERVRPFNKFLTWELENFPLTKLTVSSKYLLDKIQIILQNGDLRTQKEVLEIVKKLAIENEYIEDIKGWDGYYFG
ncbi:MAG: hypothetical protein WCJ59_01605 [bacterium]